MPSLNKSTLALTFKFDCDRFLRFRLASKAEKAAIGLKEDTYYRPGIDLIKDAGRRWEADKYQDLIDAAGTANVEYRLGVEDPDIGRRKFEKVENIFDILRNPHLPTAIVEGEFLVPTSITPALQEAYDKFGLDRVKARPDIIWLRPALTGAPLIGGPKDSLEYEIHIIDVKMTAEPSLRHFTEVTYYALALAAALREEGLSDRYAVSAEGFIWPGSHDTNAFRNLYRELASRGSAEPVTDALSKTLIAVPYEVYQVHVKQFFEVRMLRVLAQSPQEAAWHVSPKCQLCEYLDHCMQEAEATDHLSRIPWLTYGQADLMRKNNIVTTAQLRQAIQQRTSDWQAIQATSQQLRADSGALLARAGSLHTNEPELVSDRLCALMPQWADLNIFVSVHFDMGSGITFAMGAMRVYYQPGRAKGDPPQREERTFIVDRVDKLNPDTERARLIEFVDLVSIWLQEVSDYNETVSKQERLSAHIFFWDALELKQLGRMLRRHMDDPAVLEKIELLMRLFPPENVLPDPDLFRSQPGTVVKEVIRMLVGLPLAHDYTLLEAASAFFPFIKEDGEAFKYNVPFGFKTPMTDQIPFERAYELWQDKILLAHYDPRFPTQPQKWRKYTRDEIYEWIKKAVKVRLHALDRVVSRLKEHYSERLTLRKSAFKAAPPVQTRIPERARNLIAFARLNAAVAEMKNRQDRSLPVEEREARFISIRSLLPANGQLYDEAIRDLRLDESRYAARQLWAMTFAPDSRDCRIREGDFLLALSNEGSGLDLDITWYKLLSLNFEQGKDMLVSVGLEDQWLFKAPLWKFLQVELARLESTSEPPFLILMPVDPSLFQFACDTGFIDPARPMVLDPVHRDFESERIRQSLTLIGGTPPPLRRRKRG